MVINLKIKCSYYNIRLYFKEIYKIIKIFSMFILTECQVSNFWSVSKFKDKKQVITRIYWKFFMKNKYLMKNILTPLKNSCLLWKYNKIWNFIFIVLVFRKLRKCFHLSLNIYFLTSNLANLICSFVKLISQKVQQWNYQTFQ